MNIINKTTKEIDINVLNDEQTFFPVSSAYFFLNVDSVAAGSPAIKPTVEPIARDSAPYKNGVDKTIAKIPNASR